MNRLQLAMDAANVDELEAEAEVIGREAVQKALAAPDLAAETQRQRDLDAALADAIEVVARHRARLGRRICSRHDGEQVRRIFELLRGLMDAGGDQDSKFSMRTPRPAKFRQIDVKRAIAGAKAAGLSVSRCEIDAEGKIVLVSDVASVATLNEATSAYQRWKAQQNGATKQRRGA